MAWSRENKGLCDKPAGADVAFMSYGSLHIATFWTICGNNVNKHWVIENGNILFYQDPQVSKKESMWNNKFLILGSLLRFFLMETRGGNRDNCLFFLHVVEVSHHHFHETKQNTSTSRQIWNFTWQMTPKVNPRGFAPMCGHERSISENKKGSLHN